MLFGLETSDTFYGSGSGAGAGVGGDAGISFAGESLLLEDPEGTVRRWLRRHLSELEASIFCMGNTATSDLRHESMIRGGNSFSLPRVGLPVGNYPTPPKPRINSLYHPSGAKRWAQGLFLVTETTRDTILAAVPSGQSATFRIADGTDSVELPLHLLPPRPVSPANVTGERLWLLPLVDERYYWQLHYVDEFTAQATWEDLLAQVGGGDSPSFSSGVDAVWGNPFGSEWTRHFDQSAMLIDAIALTLQRRVVRDAAGTGMFGPYVIQTAADASSDLIANLAAGANRIVAGGDFSTVMQQAVRPLYVSVAFPHYGDINPPIGPVVYDELWVEAFATSSPPRSSWKKTFHCASPNDSGSHGSPGAVSGAEQSLCDAVASEYLAWLTHHYDVTYSGILAWEQSGFDDYVRWSFTRRPGGNYVCQTRAVSMPPNFGCDNLPINV